METYSVGVMRPVDIVVEAESFEDAVRRVREGEGFFSEEYCGDWKFPALAVGVLRQSDRDFQFVLLQTEEGSLA